MVVGACAEIDDEAAGRFKVDFKVGTRAPGTVGCIEFKYLCLGVEYIALRNTAHELIIRVFDFAAQAQERRCGEGAFYVCAEFEGQVAGREIQIAQLFPRCVVVERGAGLHDPIGEYLHPLEVVQCAVGAAFVNAVKGGFCDANAQAVARVEAEEFEASGWRVLVDQIEVAVVSARRGGERSAVAVDAKQKISKAEVAGEAYAQFVGHKGQVEAQRASGEAQVECVAFLRGHVLGFHGQDCGECVAIARGKSACGEDGALYHKGRDGAEDAACGRFVFVGMHDCSLSEQYDGFAYVASAHKEASAVIDGCNAWKGFECAEYIGRSARCCHDIQGREGYGFLFPSGIGACRDGGFVELDEDEAQDEANSCGIAGR